jgi:hypothetical protein
MQSGGQWLRFEQRSAYLAWRAGFHASPRTISLAFEVKDARPKLHVTPVAFIHPIVLRAHKISWVPASEQS